MKVFVLGASGAYGSGAAKLLAADERVKTVALGARNTDRLAAPAEEIGAKAEVIGIDAGNSAALTEALNGSDVLVNATGFYQELIEPTLDAAINAGVAYVDISESVEAAEKAFARHKAAQTAGRTAMVGVGSTPGVTTMLGVHAARQLHRCRTLATGFVVATDLYFPGDEKALEEITTRQRPLAVHQTMIEIFADPVQVVENATLHVVDPMQSRRKVKLPGHDETWMYPVAMSTAATLRDHLPDTDSIAVCMAFLPDAVNAAVYRHAQTYKQGNADIQTAVAAMFSEIGRLPEEQKSAPAGLPAYMQWAAASGEKDGAEITVNLGLAEPLSTAAALAAGALALGSGVLRKPGVWPVEACFDPMQFFDTVSQVQYGRAYNRDALLMESG